MRMTFYFKKISSKSSRRCVVVVIVCVVVVIFALTRPHPPFALMPDFKSPSPRRCNFRSSTTDSAVTLISPSRASAAALTRGRKVLPSKETHVGAQPVTLPSICRPIGTPGRADARRPPIINKSRPGKERSGEGRGTQDVLRYELNMPTDDSATRISSLLK